MPSLCSIEDGKILVIGGQLYSFLLDGKKSHITQLYAGKQLVNYSQSRHSPFLAKDGSVYAIIVSASKDKSIIKWSVPKEPLILETFSAYTNVLAWD